MTGQKVQKVVLDQANTHGRSFKRMLCIAAMCFLLSVDALAAITNTWIEPSADVDIRSGVLQDEAYNRDHLFIQYKNSDPNVGVSGKAYVRFSLPSDFGFASSVTFKMTRSAVGAWGWNYDVYGLNDGAGGEFFVETENAPPGITWNSAPGNDTASSNKFLGTESSLLGAWQVLNPSQGGLVGDQYSITTSALTDHINNDANGSVVLMVARNGVSTSNDLWASKENTSFNGPSLQLTYLTRQTASDRWASWVQNRNGQLPISSWSYFGRYNEGVQEYQTFKDAGLTMVNTPRLTVGGSMGQINSALSVGLDVLLGQAENLHMNRQELINAVGLPSPVDTRVIGYTLEDEPLPDQFSDLKSASYYIYEHDQRGAIPIVNLLPNYAWKWGNREQIYGVDYEGYVQKYIDEVHPAVLVHTHYPIMKTGADRPEYYSNLELFRTKALENGIGVFGFVLVTDHGDEVNGHRRASGSDIRWQVNSHLAYGAKGIYYYNYRIEQGIGFGEGLVDDLNGNPTDLYSLVQSANQTASAHGQVLMGLISTGVFHTGNDSDDSIPDGTIRYTTAVDSPFDRFWGKEFLQGVFIDESSSSIDRYVMLVNKRHAAGLDISSILRSSPAFTIDLNFDTVYILDPVTGMEQLLAPVGVYQGRDLFSLTLEGGEAALLRFTHVPEPRSFAVIMMSGAVVLLRRCVRDTSV